MAGAALGSIIAAIIDTHTARKNPNEPSWVETPMSIPLICRNAMTQHTAARASVAVSATALRTTSVVAIRFRTRALGASMLRWCRMSGILFSPSRIGGNEDVGRGVVLAVVARARRACADRERRRCGERAEQDGGP